MKKVFDKIIKNAGTSRPVLSGVHYTNNRLEITDSHVAIIEEYKTPLNIEFDFIIGSDSKPIVVNYPDLRRLVPIEHENEFNINIPLLESITKLHRKDIGIELNLNGQIDGVTVGFFERIQEFDHITFSPKFLLLMIEYLKESGLKKQATIYLSNSPVKPAFLTFEETNSVNTFIITPIRTEKDMK